VHNTAKIHQSVTIYCINTDIRADGGDTLVTQIFGTDLTRDFGGSKRQ
jgi:hypothetical protein